MAGNRRAPPVVPPAGGIRVLGRIGSLGPGFRIFRIIARFSKYDFWIPGKILDLSRKNPLNKKSEIKKFVEKVGEIFFETKKYFPDFFDKLF